MNPNNIIIVYVFIVFNVCHFINKTNLTLHLKFLNYPTYANK